MDDYIDRNDLIAEFKRLTLGENSLVERLFADGVYAVIETFPAADVAPVQRSFWESYDTSAYIGVDDTGEPRYAARKFFVCHNRKCRYKVVVRTKYCPNCGRRMDGGADNG